MSKKGTEQEEENVKDIPVWKCLLFMVLGGVMVVMGSDFAVSGATEIARFFGMSERFIGLTIVAFGTSLPELVTSVTAARKGNAGIAIGNIVGSNIFNILFVIGTAQFHLSVNLLLIQSLQFSVEYCFGVERLKRKSLESLAEF